MENMVRDFLATKSPATAHVYNAGLKRFAAHCAGLGQPLSSLTPEQIGVGPAIGFCNSLIATDLASTSRDSYMTSVLALYKFILLVEESSGFSHRDYMRLQQAVAGLRSRQSARPLPKLPDEGDVKALFEEAYAAPQHTTRLALLRLRDIALLETLRSTGARVGEIVALRCKDLATEAQAALVTGKGRKQRVVFFDELAWTAIDLYLAIREHREDSDPIFVRYDRQAKDKQMLSTDAVRVMINKYADLAGIANHLHPHLFRHRFASKVLAGTGNLATAQDMLGHASPATTRIYTRLAPNVLAEAHASIEL